ncbi:MAG: LicD family protein [Bacteroidales bacterium]|nr:LicD family protein [Bacteroidales bacterium]
MNLAEEVRKGFTISVEMKKVWKVQMDLLKKLLEVCEKYHLKIWADGGTLLGTVRDHGYIPWDDDIDMAMLRDDYDKLVQIAPKEFGHPFFFQCGYSEIVYPRGHAQLRMDGTTAISPSEVFINTHQGIFIDIFPYDAVPDNKEERQSLLQQRKKKLAFLQHLSANDPLHPLRTVFMMTMRPFFQYYYRQFENLLRSNQISDNKCVACLGFTDDLTLFERDKEWYKDTLFFPFEDMMMPVPSGYDQILRKQYGDYMVPRQAPTYHGGFWKLDPETPYELFLPELRVYSKQLKKARIKSRINRLLKRIK